MQIKENCDNFAIVSEDFQTLFVSGDVLKVRNDEFAEETTEVDGHHRPDQKPGMGSQVQREFPRVDFGSRERFRVKILTFSKVVERENKQKHRTNKAVCVKWDVRRGKRQVIIFDC